MMLLKRILQRVTIRLLLALRRRAPGLAFLVALVIAAAIVLPGPLGGPAVSSSGMALGESELRLAEGEPAATAAYLRGMQLGDAQLMWETFSERARQEFLQAGGGIPRLQRQLDVAHETGIRIVRVQYVGSAPVPEGRMVFYAVAQTNRGGRDVTHVPYSFTVNASGQIEQVHL